MEKKLLWSQVVTFPQKIKSRQEILGSFLLLGLFFFFLPGLNFYQTQILQWRRPDISEVPIPFPSPFAYPREITKISPPFLTAEAAIVMDIPSAVVLYAKNPEKSFSPASTTKIMTALIGLARYKLEDVLTVQTEVNEGRSMALKKGEKLTFESLLYGLLVHSANDAALTIAENFPGGKEQFIYSMNQKAHQLNMNSTHFENVTGFEQENHYISSIDLARLAVYALQNPTFVKIVGTREITVKDINQKEEHHLENVNQLLGRILGVYGVKTGWTENAGGCLVAAVERKGRKILTVVLKSQDRFGETARLIEWTYKNHRWEEVNLSTQRQ